MEEGERNRAPNRPRRGMGTFAAGVVAGGLAIGVGLAGLSAWSSASADPAVPGPASAGAAAPGMKMLRPDGGRPGEPGVPGPPLPGMLRMGPRLGVGGLGIVGGRGIHGEQTTRKPGGGYQTLATQVGEVTSASKSSIAVKSEDGYTRTYAVDDKTRVLASKGGISDIQKGDRVQVLAVVEGNGARLLHVVDLSKLPAVDGKPGPLRKQLEDRRKELSDRRQDLLEKQKRLLDEKRQSQEGLRKQIEERRRIAEQKTMAP